MEVFGLIFRFVYELLNMEIEVFDYRFTLMNVFIYGIVIYGLLLFLLKVFFHKGDN